MPAFNVCSSVHKMGHYLFVIGLLWATFVACYSMYKIERFNGTIEVVEPGKTIG